MQTAAYIGQPGRHRCTEGHDRPLEPDIGVEQTAAVAQEKACVLILQGDIAVGKVGGSLTAGFPQAAFYGVERQLQKIRKRK